MNEAIICGCVPACCVSDERCDLCEIKGWRLETIIHKLWDLQFISKLLFTDKAAVEHSRAAPAQSQTGGRGVDIKMEGMMEHRALNAPCLWVYPVLSVFPRSLRCHSAHDNVVFPHTKRDVQTRHNLPVRVGADILLVTHISSLPITHCIYLWKTEWRRRCTNIILNVKGNMKVSVRLLCYRYARRPLRFMLHRKVKKSADMQRKHRLVQELQLTSFISFSGSACGTLQTGRSIINNQIWVTKIKCWVNVQR